MARKHSDMVILNGNSHPQLANSIASRLNEKLGSCSLYRTSNRESVLAIGVSVRARDVYLIQSGGPDVNNNIMELLIMAYTCKTSAANNIVGVIPYLPYGKQSKMRKRGSIVSKLMAQLMVKAGFTHLITVDMHHKETQGFFDIPVENLRASPFLLQYIQENITDYRETAIIVARYPGAVRKATSYAERLRIGLAVIHGEDKEAETDHVDGRTSPPAALAHQEFDLFVGLDGLPSFPAKEKPPISIVGDVSGRVAIMIDDCIDDVQSFVTTAEHLRDHGASKIYVLATHGFFGPDAPGLIENSPIDEVIVTNTVPHELQKMRCNKIKTIDISILLSEAMRRIQNNESLSYLFKNVALED
ncbi:phosphoribosyl pyrophosphate synthase-associated protein 2-like [Oppia nitens]|uniref:phosphoribosyl pyrophosphate synthase-associated protein 2-like n=1 Tax=Oppia nitens TaxID=1686743 RepID=UPI0023DA4A43|nr:phosphoribosyl pyrophosphate synthase-associated protein 2-like [Oppia nitens]